jgi:putative hydrolase of the HAD superfamily
MKTASIKIKAVLFDADGVVINPRMQFSRFLAEVFEIPPQMTRGFFTGVFNDCLTGRADLLAVLPPYLEEWGWPGDTADFLRLWMAKDDCPDLRLLAHIQRLRADGLLCGLATLQEKHRAAYMREAMGFSRRFDRLFFSCELGCLKPDPAARSRTTSTSPARGSSSGTTIRATSAPPATSAGWQRNILLWQALKNICALNLGKGIEPHALLCVLRAFVVHPLNIFAWKLDPLLILLLLP